MAKKNVGINKNFFYLIAALAIINTLAILAGYDGLASSGSGAGQQIQVPTEGESPSARVQVSVDDDASLGGDNAQVTVIEFSDFQCPFCRRSFEDMLPSLKTDYINTNKVKFVYRDFPLSFHPMAQPAAEATECAREQEPDFFWEMHDLIFEKQALQGQGTVQFTTDDLKEWAKEIDGLDHARWEVCLNSGKYKNEVEEDIADGSAAGVSGTPTFFIGNDEDGYVRVVGAQPYSTIKAIIEQELQ